MFRGRRTGSNTRVPSPRTWPVTEGVLSPVARRPRIAFRVADKMPITYTHDERSGLTRVSCVGLLAAADLAAHWAEIYADAGVLAGGRILIDLRESDIGFTGAEVIEMASRDWPVEPTASLAMAVLVATPEQFDAARQFQLVAREGAPHQIFFDEAAALEWLTGD